jgi:hypothetical protein
MSLNVGFFRIGLHAFLFSLFFMWNYLILIHMITRLTC